jgi:hypothetical protein|tara:strand:- start:40 stop:240 length:201 start_codon:yes stop_codon:yes gene_type:complete
MRPNALAAVAAMGVVKHAVAVTKVAGNALATVQSPALKVAKCLYTAAFLNAVSTIQTFAPSTQLST